MAAGNWTPELIEMAGGVNLFGEAGKHSPWMTWEELRAADPDVIVIAPCGFDLARTEQEMHWHDRTAPGGAICARCAPAACIWRMAIGTSTGPVRAWWRRWRSLVEMLHDRRPPGPWPRTAGAWRRYHELVTWR